MVAALQRRRADFLAAHRDPPPGLTVVRAKVLKHATPLKYRQAAAGDSQYAQTTVRAMRLSGWAEALLTPDVQAESDATKRLSLSIQKSGLDRTMKLVCVACLVGEGGVVMGEGAT